MKIFLRDNLILTFKYCKCLHVIQQSMKNEMRRSQTGLKRDLSERKVKGSFPKKYKKEKIGKMWGNRKLPLQWNQ